MLAYLAVPVRFLFSLYGIWSVHPGTSQWQDRSLDIHQVAFLTQPHEKVVWLDVSVYEVLAVYVLDPRDDGRRAGLTIG